MLSSDYWLQARGNKCVQCESDYEISIYSYPWPYSRTKKYCSYKIVKKIPGNIRFDGLYILYGYNPAIHFLIEQSSFQHLCLRGRGECRENHKLEILLRHTSPPESLTRAYLVCQPLWNTCYTLLLWHLEDTYSHLHLVKLAVKFQFS